MSRIVIVTAVRAEARAALDALSGSHRVRPAGRPCWEGRAGANQVTVVQGGVGREAARRALEVPSGPCDLVVSFGFAGALVRGAEPGAVVIPRAVVWEEKGELRRYDVPGGAASVVEEKLPGDMRPAAIAGAILSSATVLATPAAKEEAGRRYGAVAVEMEAATLAAYAAGNDLGFLPLRAILDPMDLSLAGLPPNLDRSWAARVRVLGKPGSWPLLLALGRHMRAATTALRRAAEAVLPELAGGGGRRSG